MPRQEKGSGIKFLPPKVQIQQRDQFRLIPTVNMVGSQSLAWDDQKFETLNRQGVISLPTGLIASSPLLPSNFDKMQVSGRVNANVIDSFIRPTELDLSFAPFKEEGLAASDAKRNEDRNEFYATGSRVEDIGEGFTTPLWSKTKLEFDITPATTHTFGIVNFLSSSDNFVMAYWNKQTKTYQGIGNGNEFDKYRAATTMTNMESFFSEKCIGFGASLDNGGTQLSFVSASFLLGNPITNFGFPSTENYQGTDANLIKMSEYISEPFLVEKIVLYFSGTMNHHNYFTSSRGSITTFFVLNQRGAYVKNVSKTMKYNEDSDAGLSITFDSGVQTTTRDLVTWVQMSQAAHSGYAEYDRGLRREYNYDVAPLTGQLVVSGTVKSPLEYTEGPRVVISAVDDPSRNSAEYFETYQKSGRSLIEDNGRSFVNPWETPTKFGEATFASQLPGISSVSSPVNAKYSKTNPYILLPTDNLIFGFQVPTSLIGFNERTTNLPIYNGIGPHITASASGIHKVVLYGSLLRDNHEYHDTFQQAIETDIISTMQRG
jgi:hypothetical protein